MRSTLRIAAILAAAMAWAPASAQVSGALDQRVGKLEKEMKAVQRTVFPGGAPVQPELAAPADPAIAAGTPASTPVADLTLRIDALEKGFAGLTGQVEQSVHQNRLADEAIKRLEARIATLEGAANPASAAAGGPIVAPLASEPVAAPALVRPTPALAKPAAAKADPARKAAVAEVEIPATGDAAEDAYSYGYRLYSAKLYPEAAATLKEFVAKHPTHRRASYAQNLLGRAYFDEGKPALASVAFYDNYQKMPKGERAPESLYWLGQSLAKLKKASDACKVYDELSEVYGATLTPDLQAKAAKGRADAKCAA